MKKRENCADDKALLKICELKNNYYEDVTVLLNLVAMHSINTSLKTLIRESKVIKLFLMLHVNSICG
jgi:hypothetical protein